MTQKTAAAAPTAVDLLVGRVKVPAFFEKLARDWNIVPQTKADEEILLTMAAHLRAAQTQNRVKQASAGAHPFLANALQGLEASLQQNGVDIGASNQEQMLKEAAYLRLSQDDELARAALSVAEQLAAQA